MAQTKAPKCGACRQTGHNSRTCPVAHRNDSLPTAPEPAPRTDGWENMTTGVGIAGRDRRLPGAFFAHVVSDEEAVELWRGDDLAARIIEEPVDDMLREGWELTTQDDADQDVANAVTDQYEELDTTEKFREAMQYERAYGGGAILLGAVDNNTDVADPLNLNTVRSLDWMTPLEPRELFPFSWYTQPDDPKFGQPELYQFAPITPGSNIRGEVAPQITTVHESRLIIFPGIRVSRRQINMRNGWGDSRLTRVFTVLRDFESAFDGSALMLTEFSQAVMKMKGLAELLAEDGAKALFARMQGVQLCRSMANAVLIDENEEFTREQLSLSGYPDMLDRWLARLASAAEMTITKLFGMSPAGLNATGESDIRQDYDRAASRQKKHLKPRLRYLTEILFAVQKNTPKSWDLKFNPLWQETNKEREDARKVRAETDALYIANDVLSPDEVADSRFGRAEFSFETTVDFDEREKQAALEPDPDPDPTPPPTPEPEPGDDA